MLDRLLRRFRQPTLRQQVELAIRRGTGLQREEWDLPPRQVDRAALDTLAAEVTAWCQARMGETRRPYGIDQLALALACAEPGGPVIASQTFGIFRPVEFYQDDGVGGGLRGFFAALSPEELASRTGPVRIAAALFSWGDIARETIFADDAQDGPSPERPS